MKTVSSGTSGAPGPDPRSYRNAVVADSAVAGAAAENGGAGGAIGAAVAAYAPGGALGAAHHDDDVIAGIRSEGDE